MGLPFQRTSPKYTARAVDFDGSAAYLSRGADLTGNADGKAGTLSIWLRIDGGDAAILRIIRNLTGATTRFTVARFSSNKFTVAGLTGAGVTILSMTSTTSYTAGAPWRHLLASWDLAATTGHMYVNDVNDLAGGPTFTNDTIDYTLTDWYIGAESGPAAYFNGCMSELWFSPTYIDLSIRENRRRFIGADGKPVSLGADGSKPTGTRPLIYLANEETSWQTNLGSGGGFTENGTLGTASTVPSG